MFLIKAEAFWNLYLMEVFINLCSLLFCSVFLLKRFGSPLIDSLKVAGMKLPVTVFVLVIGYRWVLFWLLKEWKD